MSIFSGLSPENLRVAFEAAKSSPRALAAVIIALAFAVLAVGLAAAFVSRGVGGFHAHVLDEEERAVPAPTSEETLDASDLSDRGPSFAASGEAERAVPAPTSEEAFDASGPSARDPSLASSENSPQSGGGNRNDEEES